MDELGTSSGITSFDFIADERSLRQIVDSIPVGAMLADSCGNIILTNAELDQALGYLRGELAGKSIDILLPEKTRHKHSGLVSEYIKAPGKRQMGPGRELYAQRKDGEKIPIEIGLNPLRIGGEVRVLATLIDISPRLRAHSMFKRSANSAPHGILVVDAEGSMRLVNKTLCGYFGYSEEELLGEPIEKLLPLRYRGHHHQLRKTFADSPSVRMMGIGRDLTALHRDGREFPVEIGLSPFEDGETEGLVLVSLMDITERKRMEMDLRDANTNLEEFTYVASHDLRSPLRGIADLISWIKDDLGTEIDESVAHNIDRVDIRVRRMEQLIESLLTYARSGKVDALVQTVNITTMINETCDFISIPDNVQISVKSGIDSIETPLIPIETIFRNVISNAINHNDKTVAEIEVDCREENNMCHFTVMDNGPGIPPSSLDRVFRLFQSASTSGSEGTGIGLSICRRMAEVHGGKISVENNNDRPGVTFHIWWPRFLRKDSYDQ